MKTRGHVEFMKISIYLISLTILPFSISADTLKPFTSDGCSAFPDGTFKQRNLWLSGCQKHDFDYWKVGTYQARLDSDNALKTCVSNVGEPYPRFYGVLTESELHQVNRLSIGLSWNKN